MKPSLIWWKFWPLYVLVIAWALFRLLAQYRAVSWILHSLRAKRLLPGSGWYHVTERAASLAYEHRLPKPVLYVLPEFSPNALALRGNHGTVHFALTEGLLQVLSQSELDAVLVLLLAQASFRDCAKGARLSFFLRPFCVVLGYLPAVFWTFFSPFLMLIARLSLRPARILRSDRRAIHWCQSPELSMVMQKIFALSRKIPMRHWNLAFDHLYLLSPLQIDAALLPFISTHPPVEFRLRRLLELALKS